MSIIPGQPIKAASRDLPVRQAPRRYLIYYERANGDRYYLSSGKYDRIPSWATREFAQSYDHMTLKTKLYTVMDDCLLLGLRVGVELAPSDGD